MLKDKFKKVLKEENVTMNDLAAQLGKSVQTLYNTFHMDGTITPGGKIKSVNFSTAEEMLNAVGYEIVFRHKESGKIID